MMRCEKTGDEKKKPLANGITVSIALAVRHIFVPLKSDRLAYEEEEIEG